MDIGRVMNLASPFVKIVNLYMDEKGRWFEHGDKYIDDSVIDNIIKVVKLNKSQKLDKRFL